MNTNNFLLESYKTYESVISIINKITDNAFISVTEFSVLLNTILGTVTINPEIISDVLCEKKIITKRKKSEYINEKKLGLKPCKYIPNTTFENYYKKINMKDYSFYIWNADFIFKLLHLDFKNKISKSKIIEFYNSVKQHTNQKLDITLIGLNLLKLQFILKKECLRYK